MLERLPLPPAERPMQEPMLAGDPLRLHLQTQEESWSLAWQQGAWANTWETDTAPAALADGILALEDLEHLSPTMASVNALRNGLLTQGGGLLGWAPDVAFDRAHRPHLVFDHADEGNFDIWYRSPDGKTTPLSEAPAFQAHPSLAIDQQDRLWVAWDEGGADWGRAKGLHQSRRLHLTVYHDGAWHEVALPAAATLLAPPAEDPQAPVATAAELPRLAIGQDGELWLFFRAMRVFPAQRQSARVVSWEIRATTLAADGWSEVLTLPDSSGANHDTLALLPDAKHGVLAVWTSDLRRPRFDLNLNWYQHLMTRATPFAAHLQRQQLAAAPGQEVLGPRRSVRPRDLGPQQAPSWTADPAPDLVPKGLHRYWGDLHRHSDLSRCKMDVDGSLSEQFRYARGVGGLDFLAITDHYQHLSRSAWSIEMILNQRHNDPQQFTTLFGFERVSDGGHRNMITPDVAAAREGPFRKGKESAVLAGYVQEPYVAIPHQIADRGAPLSWPRHLASMETLVEIFQGRRGSYEAPDAPRLDLGEEKGLPHVVDYLQQGRRVGFLASSDHVSSSHAYAAVLAEDNSRSAIFAALQARRTYAATAKIALDVRLGKLRLGESGIIAADTPLTIRVDAGSPLAAVDVLRNGKLVQRWSGDTDPEDGWQQGILSVRFGRVGGDRQLSLQGQALSFGPATACESEADDLLQASAAPGESWSAGLKIQAHLEPRDVDGWMIPVRYRADATEPAVGLTIGGDTSIWKLQDLGAGPVRRRLADTTISLQLHPPAMTTPRLQVSYAPTDWQAGDWVYVRVLRADGGMAWSSPIWVDGLE